MKKRLIAILALVFALGISCNVLAAESSFSDVPAQHWAYESITKLSKAGLLDGYADRTFRGDKTITRYEMALLVAKATANEAKADAAMKTEITKLQAEFNDELTKLGVRMSKVEKRVDATEKVKFGIQVRQLWESNNDTPGNPNNEMNRYRFWMRTKLDDNATFIARIGQTTNTSSNGTSDNTGLMNMEQAYLKTSVGKFTVNIGRQGLTSLANGLIIDNSINWDGVTVENTTQKLSTKFGELKRGWSNTTYGASVGGVRDFYLAHAKYQFNPNFNLMGLYLKDNGKRVATNASSSSLYNTIGYAFNYNTGLFTLSREAAKNRTNQYSTPARATYTKLRYGSAKYGPADTNNPKSWDVTVGYRKAELGFDPFKLSMQTQLDNVKGWDVGYEFIPFKNVFATLGAHRYTDTNNSAVKHDGVSLQLDINF